jgi:hypothetical protein
MARNQHYGFRTMPALILFADIIPMFRTTIKHLNYQPFDNWKKPEQIPQIVKSITDGLAHLGVLPNLTSLNITDECEKVSLNQIVVSCPSLQKLDLYDVSRHTGSLKGLRRLQRLVVYDYELEEHTESREQLVPIDSAHSLTNLQFFGPGTANNVYTSKHLVKFVNLTKLTVDPLCNQFCKTIVAANFEHLRKFAAIVHADTDISVENILQLLQTGSLASLQELLFLVEPLEWEFNQAYFDIIRTITTHLSMLEELQLTLGINTAWCVLFSKLRHLKSIAWVCSEDECFDSTDMSACTLDHGVSFMTDQERADMTAVVMQRMKAVFGEFQEQPEVNVYILGGDQSPEWDELFEGYEELFEGYEE